MSEEVVLDASQIQTLPFVFTLEARKVAAKIALASVAYNCGVPYVLSPQFEALGQVRPATTGKEMPVRVFCNKTFMAAHARTAHQHSVMCYRSAGKKKGWALVTLFGGLSYVAAYLGKLKARSRHSESWQNPFQPATRDAMAVLSGQMSQVRDPLCRFLPQGDHGIDAHGVAGGNVACGERPTGPTANDLPQKPETQAKKNEIDMVGLAI